jgi:pyruvate formate lyase activating enzyme
LIKEGNRGLCGVRINKKGILYVINYPYTIAASIDPIEKKPLFGFLPKTKTYSFAAEGCNFTCKWCQNHEIAQGIKKRRQIKGTRVLPEEHIRNALRYQCPSISYTYTEPTIFLEYALKTMKLAHQKNIKNVWVSNGYMSQATLSQMLPYLDAINIDYKAASKEAYKKYTGGEKNTVLRNLKTIQSKNVHLEVTCLIVPGVNDKEDQLKEMLEDLYDLLGSKQILHISRFYGAYKMQNTSPTSIKTLMLAKHIAKNLGFEQVYLGNV